MHCIKYKKCLAQQDDQTLLVTVSKEGCISLSFRHAKRLSGKELRTDVDKYLRYVGGGEDG